MGCEGPPPTIPLQLYNHGDSVSCSGTYIWGDSWQGRTPPPLLSTLEPPKTVEGGDPIAPTLHPPPQLNSPHTPNPQPRSSGGLKPQRGQIWSQNGTFVRWGRRHPLFLWGERHLCAVSALAQRHLLLPRAALALFNTGVADGGTHTPSLMRQGDRP